MQISEIFAGIASDDEAERAQSITALEELDMDSHSVPFLIQQTNSTNTSVRFWSTTIIAKLASRDPSIAQRLKCLAMDEEACVRQAALDAILTSECPGAADLFARALDDKSVLVRHDALRHLGSLSRKGQVDEVVPHMVKALDDSDSHVRLVAIMGLLPLGAKAVSAIPALERCITAGGNSDLLFAARCAIKSIKAKAVGR